MKLLERPHLSEDDIQAFKASISAFTELMVDAWGETHITHYMVSFTLSINKLLNCFLV